MRSPKDVFLVTILCCFLQQQTTTAFGSVQDIPIVQLKRDFKVVARGDSVKLVCPISGQPAPIITWTKGAEAITDYAWTRFSLDKKSLKISQVEYDDTGIYVCKGTNGYGSNEVRIDLFVIGEDIYKKWSPNKGIPPILTEETNRKEESYFLQSGSSLKLGCKALGQPEPKMFWLKDNFKIEDMDSEKISLTQMTRKDSGVYTCVAQNKHGYAAKNFSIHINQQSSVLANTEVQKPDLMPAYSSIEHLIIPNDPSNTTVEEDGKATLECKAKGKSTWLKKLQPGEVINVDPTSVITLQPDAFLVIQESETKQVENFANSKNDFYISRLILNKVSLSDSGMYICVVNDDKSRSTFKYAYLQVKESEKSGKFDNKDTLIIAIAACLGALLLVFLILIITFILKRRKNKPRNSDSPEARERMLQNQQNNQDFFAPNWTTLNPKMGLPLPPTPLESSQRHNHHQLYHQPQNPRQHYRR